MPATARMPATVWMQATAVTQATTVTPAASNSKDDSNHDRSQQQEHKQQQEWQQEQDHQNSMDAIKMGGIAVSRHVAGAAGDAKCPRRPCYYIPRKEIHKWDFRCSVISRQFCERHSKLYRHCFWHTDTAFCPSLVVTQRLKAWTLEYYCSTCKSCLYLCTSMMSLFIT